MILKLEPKERCAIDRVSRLERFLHASKVRWAIGEHLFDSYKKGKRAALNGRPAVWRVILLMRRRLTPHFRRRSA